MLHNSIFRFTIFFIFGLSLIAAKYPVDADLMKITISNIKSTKGNMMVAIFNANQQFPGDVAVLSKVEPVIHIGKMTIYIDDLPFGEYAISIYHDENSNKILDSNLFKMPTEPYGFSNNARGRFGPPSFEDAKINFNNGQREFSITLK